MVGFDGRHNSRRWAFLTAGVFIRAKVTIHVIRLANTLLITITVENTCCHITLEVPVILFRTTVPTPFVPFTVMRRGAAAGVMVTASHNPRFPKITPNVGTKGTNIKQSASHSTSSLTGGTMATKCTGEMERRS